MQCAGARITPSLAGRDGAHSGGDGGFPHTPGHFVVNLLAFMKKGLTLC
ncbi:hypothetical protein D083_2454 [Dickeya solani RNS 08.23.3.1.A]|nr:hypothetical protein D083_2454 [Dickeya solani RNS 08.23.3.1.A]